MSPELHGEKAMALEWVLITEGQFHIENGETVGAFYPTVEMVKKSNGSNDALYLLNYVGTLTREEMEKLKKKLQDENNIEAVSLLKEIKNLTEEEMEFLKNEVKKDMKDETH